MRSSDVQRFMAALNELERTRRVDAMVGLFADDAELQNPVLDRPLVGREGARRFWEEYLDFFERVASRFTTVIVEDGRAALEWWAEATPRGSRRSVRYAGVTILELTPDGSIRRFRAYFDQTPLRAATLA
jgi:ketosteroid isomerase-like protein